jgi:hypothetical protein
LIFSECFPYGLKSIHLILREVYQAGGCPLPEFTSPGGGEKHGLDAPEIHSARQTAPQMPRYHRCTSTVAAFGLVSAKELCAPPQVSS